MVEALLLEGLRLKSTTLADLQLSSAALDPMSLQFPATLTGVSLQLPATLLKVVLWPLT